MYVDIVISNIFHLNEKIFFFIFFFSRTFTFLLSALLIPHASPPYNAVGTITHSYRHYFAFIHNPLLLRILFSAPQALYPSFILCTTE